jgi:hypothetical protein
LGKGLPYDIAFIAITGLVLVLINEFGSFREGTALYIYIPMVLAYFIGKQVNHRTGNRG